MQENILSVNTQQLNEWVVDVNETLYDSIDDVYQSSIPLGYFTGNVFLQNLGPHLTFDFLIENNIHCSYDIKSTSLGINNVLIELILNVECTGILFVGFEKCEVVIQHSIPLSLQYIQGEVPNYFPYEKK